MNGNDQVVLNLVGGAVALGCFVWGFKWLNAPDDGDPDNESAWGWGGACWVFAALVVFSVWAMGLPEGKNPIDYGVDAPQMTGVLCLAFAASMIYRAIFTKTGYLLVAGALGLLVGFWFAFM